MALSHWCSVILVLNILRPCSSIFCCNVGFRADDLDQVCVLLDINDFCNLDLVVRPFYIVFDIFWCVFADMRVQLPDEDCSFAPLLWWNGRCDVDVLE